MKKLLIFAIGSISFLNAQNFTDLALALNVDASTISLDGFGSGVCFYDFNQDGWDDITFTLESDTQVFYINNQGSFQKANFNLYINGRAKQTLWLDYDNDEDLDLLISVFDGQCYLFQNDGNFNFTDVSLAAGLTPFTAFNYGISSSDYNKDGFLDIYLCRYTPDSIGLIDFNALYLNNGDGTFTNTAFQAGVADGIAPSFIGVWIDYNRDTWPDLYVINDRGGWDNSLYRNNQDGSFTDVTDSTYTRMAGNDPMTVSVADFDNDQDLDMYISNTGISPLLRPNLFVNNQNIFTNYADSFDLELNTTSWGGLWFDYDNDGFQDLYVATSFTNVNTPPVRNYFYKNRFPLPFEEDGSIFLGNNLATSHAVARGDFNNDGFYDVLVQNNSPYFPNLYLNSANSNNYIKLSLQGTVSNYFAIGSWITVYAGSNVYTQYTLCGENYIGQNSQHHIFGLATANMVDSIIVEYPSGVVDKYFDLPVNQSILLIEGETSNTLDINIVGNNPFCQGDSVVLSAPSMSSYLWNTGDTTQSIVVFDEGSYLVNAIDSNGSVQVSNPYILNQILLPSVSSYSSNVTCNGTSDGELFLDLNNEGQTYQIDWDNGSSGDTLLNLSADTYVFTYLDEYGCLYQDSIHITEPLPLHVYLDIVPETPFQQGAVQILINGGVEPYEVLLNGTEIADEITYLDSGSYELLIIDANGCLKNEMVFIEFQDTSTISSLREGLEDNFKAYPNPFDDYIELNALDKEITYQLYNSLGQLILQGSEKMVKTVNLQQGIFYLHMSDEIDHKVVKMLKLN